MRLQGPRSLRARLLTATLVLAAIGLAVAGVTTYRFLESFLLRRVDQQLASTAQPGGAIDRILDQAHGYGPAVGLPAIGVPARTWAAFLTEHDQIDPPAAKVVAYNGQRVPGPRLPAGWPGRWPDGGDGGPGAGARFLTAPAADGSITYRVVAEELADRPRSKAGLTSPR